MHTWVNNYFTSFCRGQGLVVSYLSTIQNQYFIRIYGIVLLWSGAGGQLLASSRFGQTLLVSYRQTHKITKIQTPEQKKQAQKTQKIRNTKTQKHIS